MKEETGYTASLPTSNPLKSTSPALVLDPGLTDAAFTLVTLEVDGDAVENVDVAPQEEDQFVQLVKLKIDETVVERLQTFASKNGDLIFGGVYLFAAGLVMSSSMTKSPR